MIGLVFSFLINNIAAVLGAAAVATTTATAVVVSDKIHKKASLIVNKTDEQKYIEGILKMNRRAFAETINNYADFAEFTQLLIDNNDWDVILINEMEEVCHEVNQHIDEIKVNNDLMRLLDTESSSTYDIDGNEYQNKLTINEVKLIQLNYEKIKMQYLKCKNIKQAISLCMRKYEDGRTRRVTDDNLEFIRQFIRIRNNVSVETKFNETRSKIINKKIKTVNFLKILTKTQIMCSTILRDIDDYNLNDEEKTTIISSVDIINIYNKWYVLKSSQYLDDCDRYIQAFSKVMGIELSKNTIINMIGNLKVAITDYDQRTSVREVKQLIIDNARNIDGETIIKHHDKTSLEFQLYKGSYIVNGECQVKEVNQDYEKIFHVKITRFLCECINMAKTLHPNATPAVWIVVGYELHFKNLFDSIPAINSFDNNKIASILEEMVNENYKPRKRSVMTHGYSRSLSKLMTGEKDNELGCWIGEAIGRKYKLQNMIFEGVETQSSVYDIKDKTITETTECKLYLLQESGEYEYIKEFPKRLAKKIKIKEMSEEGKKMIENQKYYKERKERRAIKEEEKAKNRQTKKKTKDITKDEERVVLKTELDESKPPIGDTTVPEGTGDYINLGLIFNENDELVDKNGLVYDQGSRVTEECTFGGKENGEYCWLICSDFMKSLEISLNGVTNAVTWDTAEKRYKIMTPEQKQNKKFYYNKKFDNNHGKKIRKKVKNATNVIDYGWIADSLKSETIGKIEFNFNTRFRATGKDIDRWCDNMKKIIEKTDDANYQAYCKNEKQTEGLSPAVIRKVPYTVSRMSTIQEILYKIDLLPNDCPMVAWSQIDKLDGVNVFHFDPRKGYRSVGEFKAIFSRQELVIYNRLSNKTEPIAVGKDIFNNLTSVKQIQANKLIQYTNKLMIVSLLNSERRSIDSGYYEKENEESILFGTITTLKRTIFEDLRIENKGKYIEAINSHDIVTVNQYFSRNPFDVVETDETTSRFKSEDTKTEESIVYVEKARFNGDPDYWAYLDILTHKVFRIIGSKCDLSDVLMERHGGATWYKPGGRFNMCTNTDNLSKTKLNVLILPKIPSKPMNTEEQSDMHDSIGTVANTKEFGLISIPYGTSKPIIHGKDTFSMMRKRNTVIDNAVFNVYETVSNEAFIAILCGTNRYVYTRLINAQDKRFFEIPVFKNEFVNQYLNIKPTIEKFELDKMLLNDMIGKNMPGKHGYKAMVAYGMSLLWMKYTKRGDIFRENKYTEKQIKIHAYVCQVLIGRMKMMREWFTSLLVDKPKKLMLATIAAMIKTGLEDIDTSEITIIKHLENRVSNEDLEQTKYWNAIEAWLDIDHQVVTVTSVLVCQHHALCNSEITGIECSCCHEMTAIQDKCVHCMEGSEVMTCGHMQNVTTIGTYECDCCGNNCNNVDLKCKNCRNEYTNVKQTKLNWFVPSSSTPKRQPETSNNQRSKITPEANKPKQQENKDLPEPQRTEVTDDEEAEALNTISNICDEVTYNQIKSHFMDMSVPILKGELQVIPGVPPGESIMSIDSLDITEKFENNYKEYCGIECLQSAYKIICDDVFRRRHSTNKKNSATSIISMARELSLNVIVVTGMFIRAYRANVDNQFAVICYAGTIGENIEHWYNAKAKRNSKNLQEYKPCLTAHYDIYDKISKKRYGVDYSKVNARERLMVICEVYIACQTLFDSVRPVPKIINNHYKNNDEGLNNLNEGTISMDITNYLDIFQSMEKSVNQTYLDDTLIQSFDITKQNVENIEDYRMGMMRESLHKMYTVLTKTGAYNSIKFSYVKQGRKVLIDVSDTKLKNGDIVHVTNTAKPLFCVIKNKQLVLNIDNDIRLSEISLDIPQISFGSALRKLNGCLNRQFDKELMKKLKNDKCEAYIKPAGGGKSTSIAKFLAQLEPKDQKDWTVIACTSGGVTSLLRKINNPLIPVISYEKAFNATISYKNIILDECTLLRYGDVAALTEGAHQIKLYGDPTQIGVTDMMESGGVRDTSNVLDWVDNNKKNTSMKTYRFGGELLQELKQFPELKDLESHPEAPNTKVTLLANAKFDINQVMKLAAEHDQVLVFYQAHLRLIKKHVKLNNLTLKIILVDTVHGYQGLEDKRVLVIQRPFAKGTVHMKTSYVISAATRASAQLTWLSIECCLNNPKLADRVAKPLGGIVGNLMSKGMQVVRQYYTSEDPNQIKTDEVNEGSLQRLKQGSYLPTEQDELEQRTVLNTFSKLDERLERASNEGHDYGFNFEQLDVKVLNVVMRYKYQNLSKDLFAIKTDDKLILTGTRWGMNFTYTKTKNGERSTNLPEGYAQIVDRLINSVTNVQIVEELQILYDDMIKTNSIILRNDKLNTMIKNLAHIVKINESKSTELWLSGKLSDYKVTATKGCSTCCGVTITNGQDSLVVGSDYYCWGARSVTYVEDSVLEKLFVSNTEEYDPDISFGIDITNKQYTLALTSERISTAIKDVMKCGYGSFMHYTRVNNELKIAEAKSHGDCKPLSNYDNATNWPVYVTDKETWQTKILWKNSYAIINEKKVKLTCDEDWINQVCIAFFKDVVSFSSNGIHRVLAKVYTKYLGAIGGLWKPIQWHKENGTHTYEVWADKMMASDLQLLSKTKKSIYMSKEGAECFELYTKTIRVNSLDNCSLLLPNLEAACSVLFQRMRMNNDGFAMCCDIANIAYNHEDGGTIVKPKYESLSWVTTLQMLETQCENELKHTTNDKSVKQIKTKNGYTNLDSTQYKNTKYYGPNVFQLTLDEITEVVNNLGSLIFVCPSIKIKESHYSFYSGSFVVKIPTNLKEAIFDIGHYTHNQELYHIHTLHKTADIVICEIKKNRTFWVSPSNLMEDEYTVELPALNISLNDILADNSVLRTESLRINPQLFDNLSRRCLRPDTKLEDVLVQARTLYHSEIFTTKRRNKSYNVSAGRMIKHAIYAYLCDVIETNSLFLMRWFADDTTEIEEPVLTTILDVITRIASVGANVLATLVEEETKLANNNATTLKNKWDYFKRMRSSKLFQSFISNMIDFNEKLNINKERPKRLMLNANITRPSFVELTKLGITYLNMWFSKPENNKINFEKDLNSPLRTNTFYSNEKSPKVNLAALYSVEHIREHIKINSEYKSFVQVGLTSVKLTVIGEVINMPFMKIGYTNNILAVGDIAQQSRLYALPFDTWLTQNENNLYRSIVKLPESKLIAANEIATIIIEEDVELCECGNKALASSTKCFDHIFRVQPGTILDFKLSEGSVSLCGCLKYNRYKSCCMMCGYNNMLNQNYVNYAEEHTELDTSETHNNDTFAEDDWYAHDLLVNTYGTEDNCQMCESIKTRLEGATTYTETNEKDENDGKDDDEDNKKFGETPEVTNEERRIIMRHIRKGTGKEPSTVNDAKQYNGDQLNITIPIGNGKGIISLLAARTQLFKVHDDSGASKKELTNDKFTLSSNYDVRKDNIAIVNLGHRYQQSNVETSYMKQGLVLENVEKFDTIYVANSLLEFFNIILKITAGKSINKMAVTCKCKRLICSSIEEIFYSGHRVCECGAEPIVNKVFVDSDNTNNMIYDVETIIRGTISWQLTNIFEFEHKYDESEYSDETEDVKIDLLSELNKQIDIINWITVENAVSIANSLETYAGVSVKFGKYIYQNKKLNYYNKDSVRMLIYYLLAQRLIDYYKNVRHVELSPKYEGDHGILRLELGKYKDAQLTTIISSWDACRIRVQQTDSIVGDINIVKIMSSHGCILYLDTLALSGESLISRGKEIVIPTEETDCTHSLTTGLCYLCSNNVTEFGEDENITAVVENVLSEREKTTNKLTERQKLIINEIKKFAKERLLMTAGRQEKKDVSVDCAQHFLPREMLVAPALDGTEIEFIESMCARINDLSFEDGKWYLVTALDGGIDRSPLCTVDNNIAICHEEREGFDVIKVPSYMHRERACLRLLVYLLADADATFLMAGGRGGIHGRFAEDYLTNERISDASVSCIGPGFVMDNASLKTKPDIRTTAIIIAIQIAYGHVYGTDEIICEFLPKLKLYSYGKMPYVANTVAESLIQWLGKNEIVELTRKISGPVYKIKIEDATLASANKNRSNTIMNVLDRRCNYEQLGNSLDATGYEEMQHYNTRGIDFKRYNKIEVRGEFNVVCDRKTWFIPTEPTKCTIASASYCLMRQGITIDAATIKMKYDWTDLITTEKVMNIMQCLGYNVCWHKKGVAYYSIIGDGPWVMFVEYEQTEVNHIAAGDIEYYLSQLLNAKKNETSIVIKGQGIKNKEKLKLHYRLHNIEHVLGRAMNPIIAVEGIEIYNNELIVKDTRLREGYYLLPVNERMLLVEAVKYGDKYQLVPNSDEEIAWYGSCLMDIGMKARETKIVRKTILVSNTIRQCINNETYRYMVQNKPEIAVTMNEAKSIVVMYYDGVKHHNNMAMEKILATPLDQIMVEQSRNYSTRVMELLHRPYGPVVAQVVAGIIRMNLAIEGTNLTQMAKLLVNLEYDINNNNVESVFRLMDRWNKMQLVIKGRRWGVDRKEEIDAGVYEKRKLLNLLEDKEKQMVESVSKDNDELLVETFDKIHLDDCKNYIDMPNCFVSRGMCFIMNEAIIVSANIKGQGKDSSGIDIYDVNLENDKIFGEYKYKGTEKITAIDKEQIRAIENMNVMGTIGDCLDLASVMIDNEIETEKVMKYIEPIVYNDEVKENPLIEPVPATTINYIDDAPAMTDLVIPYPNKDLKMRLRGTTTEIVNQTKISTVKYPTVAAPSFTKGFHSTSAAAADLYGSVLNLAKVQLNNAIELARVANIAYVPNHKSIIEKYKNAQLTFNSKAVLNWLKERPGAHRIANECISILEDGLEVNPINKLNIHSKIESRVKDLMIEDERGGLLDRDCISIYRARLIVWQAKGITALFASVFKEAKDRIKALLNPKIVYTDGMTPQELAARFRTVRGKNLWFLEDDLKKQDRQTDRRLISVEMDWYVEHLGISKSLIELWKIAHEKWTAKNPFIRIKMDGMRQTGQATTALGNFFINLLIKTNMIKTLGARIKYMALLGDDNIIISEGRIAAEKNQYVAKTKYNMVSEACSSEDNGSFLRNIVYKTSDGMINSGPDIIRMRRKFEMPNGVSENTIENNLARITSYVHMFGNLKDLRKIIEKYEIENVPEVWYDIQDLITHTAVKYETTKARVEQELALLVETMEKCETYEHSRPMFVPSKNK